MYQNIRGYLKMISKTVNRDYHDYTITIRKQDEGCNPIGCAHRDSVFWIDGRYGDVSPTFRIALNPDPSLMMKYITKELTKLYGNTPYAVFLIVDLSDESDVTILRPIRNSAYSSITEHSGYDIVGIYVLAEPRYDDPDKAYNQAIDTLAAYSLYRDGEHYHYDVWDNKAGCLHSECNIEGYREAVIEAMSDLPPRADFDVISLDVPEDD